MVGGKKTITVILPCLNEGRTLLKCVEQIKKSLDKSDCKNSYEILVCDNGSIDNSVDVCKKHKIPFIIENKRGYGNALLSGIKTAKTKYIVMLDCDLSYKTNDIPKFIKSLEDGNDFIIGNRFKGKIENGAMPLSHRIGSRLLSRLLNLFFFTKCHDCHCGIRAFDRKKMLSCDLRSSGFEFASEMIIRAKKNKLKMAELPTDLSKDGRGHKSHLRTIRDGFRHLHQINKCKFEYSKVFRYTTTFAITTFLAFAFGFCSNLIPHEAVEKNLRESIIDLADSQLHPKTNEKGGVPRYRTYEKYGDMRDLTIPYYSDPSQPLASEIEKKYVVQCDIPLVCQKMFERNNTPQLMEYSRYWHGQASFVHYASVFFNLNTLLFIIRIVMIILFILLAYRLFKEDKLLSVAFVLAGISANIFFTSTSIQYSPVILLMLISTLIFLRLYKKESKNIDILFLVMGVLTCYFDFLTAETLTLSVPLVCYTYLEIKKGNKASFKKIISYILLWGFGYALMWALKWFINYLYYGPQYIADLFDYMLNNPARVSSNFSFWSIVVRNLSPWLPFGFIPEGAGLFAFLLVVILLFNILKNRKYIPLILVSLIPFARYGLIQSHSYGLYFMTYRASISVVMVAIVTVVIMIKDYLVIDPMVRGRRGRIKGSKSKPVA